MSTEACVAPHHHVGIRLCLSLVLAAGGARAHADLFAYKFEPGPNAPKDFKPGPTVDASGLDLAGSTFVGMDLSGANFDGANLRRTAFFQVVNQHGPASFRGADVRNAVFSESDLHAASDFTDALINGSMWVLGSRFLTVEQLRSTKSYQCQDLSECCIGGGEVRLTGQHVYPKVVLNLRGFNLRGAVFTKGDFTQCDFTGADMREVKFYAVAINQEQLLSQGRPRFGYTTREGDPFDWLRGSLYEGVAFNYMDLSGWDFSKHSLRGAQFYYARLEGARFDDCDVRDAWLDGRTMGIESLRATKSYREAAFRGTTFNGWDFGGFDFSRFNLTDCAFRFCILSDADFTDAVVSGADFRLCRRTPPTADQIRSTWNYKKGRMEGIRLPEGIAEALRRESE